MSIWTIVVAAGNGDRFGGPKQFEKIGSKRLVDRSVETASLVSDGVVVVVPKGHRWDGPPVAGVVFGGERRSDSVRAGLAEIPFDAEFVLVHDAARCLANDEIFQRVVAKLQSGVDGVVPAVPVLDTIKRIDGEFVVDTPDRSSLIAVQTPQGFRADILRKAHESEPDATDDAALVESVGGIVVHVEGDLNNRKITAQADLEWARRLAK